MAYTEFDPKKFFEQSVGSNFDPTIFNKIDESDIAKAPNFFEFVVGQKFLNTTILPKQIEIGSKIYGDICISCSDPNYVDNLFDQPLSEIRDRIQFMELGRCPRCKKSRIDMWIEHLWHPVFELVAACGQRCIPRDSLVFTKRGIVPMADVLEGDALTHGPIVKKIESGKLKLLKIKTKYNWSIAGAEDSHIVSVLNKNLDIEYKLLKDCQIGEHLLLQTPNLWAKERFKLPKFDRKNLPYGHNAKQFPFPEEVTPELARLVGYLVSDGQYSRKFNLRIISSNSQVEADIKRCCLAVFGEEPSLEEERRCKLEEFNYKCWTINGVVVMEWLNSIGLTPVTRRNKFIPPFILQSPKEIVCEFLAGLFGGDNFYFETNKKRKKENTAVRLQYSSVSKKLIKQLRIILLNMEIITRCDKLKSQGFGKANLYGEDDIEEGKESYFLMTKDSEFVKIFVDNVNLVEKKKIETLLKNSPKGRTRYYSPNKKGYFEKRSFNDWPIKLQNVVSKGYFSLPIIKIEKTEEFVEMADVQIPDTNIYTADGFVHHNSGKSKLVDLLALYQLHRYLCLPSPIQYFSLPAGEVLTSTFAALDEDQSELNLWLPFRAFYDNSPWFKNYNEFLKHHEQKLSIPLFKCPQTYIFYMHKSLYTHFTGSQHKQMRGATRFFGAVDEIGQFDKDASKKQHMMNADETHASLNNSLETLKNKCQKMLENGIVDVPIPLMANASSPLAAQDKVMRLFRESQSNPWMLGYHLGTHEFNPEYTEEKLRERHSGIVLTRDFFAIPPLSDSPFIEDPKTLEKLVDLSIPKNIVGYKKETHMDDFGDETVYLNLTCQSDKSTPRAIGVDTGYNNNAFSICMGRMDSKSGLPIVDVILRIYGTKVKPIHFPLMYEKCFTPLLDSFNIKFAAYDRWNSIEQVQKMRDKKVDANFYKLTFKDFQAIKTALMSRGAALPAPEEPLARFVELKENPEFLLENKPILALMAQILTVREFVNKLAKPIDGDDDIFRAYCQCMRIMLDPEYSKLLKTGVRPIFGRGGTVGVVRLKGNSSGGGGSTFYGKGASTTNTGIIKSRNFNKT